MSLRGDATGGISGRSVYMSGKTTKQSELLARRAGGV